MTLLLLTCGKWMAGSWWRAVMPPRLPCLGRIGAAAGALVLVGPVQVTMLGRSMQQGDRLRWADLVGTVIALGGLMALALPGLAAPDVLGLLCR